MCLASNFLCFAEFFQGVFLHPWFVTVMVQISWRRIKNDSPTIPESSIKTIVLSTCSPEWQWQWSYRAGTPGRTHTATESWVFSFVWLWTSLNLLNLRKIFLRWFLIAWLLGEFNSWWWQYSGEWKVKRAEFLRAQFSPFLMTALMTEWDTLKFCPQWRWSETDIVHYSKSSGKVKATVLLDLVVNWCSPCLRLLSETV